VSTWYSLEKYGNEINGGSVLRILRRTIAIYALGLLLTIFPYFSRDYSTLRLLGVLPRIAIAYGIGSFLCLALRREHLWIAIATILLLYWGLLRFFGGADPYSLEGNFARQVDLAVLGANHMYKGFGIPFDPEGLLSTLPAVGTVLIGYFTGGIIGKEKAGATVLFKMILIGAAGIGAGLLWNLAFPINKPLWTSSYVLYAGGIAMIALALLYLIADIWKLQGWGAFFLVFGTNALFSFFLAGIWTKVMLYVVKLPSGEEKISLYNWIYQKLCVPVAGNMLGSLMFAIIQVLIIWAFALLLYRKKIFIRL
jgi:predicted acyltransferase